MIELNLCLHTLLFVPSCIKLFQRVSVEKSKAWKRTKESQDEESQEENGATEDEATE